MAFRIALPKNSSQYLTGIDIYSIKTNICTFSNSKSISTTKISGKITETGSFILIKLYKVVPGKSTNSIISTLQVFISDKVFNACIQLRITITVHSFI